MHILAFDTETTGLPNRRRDAPLSEQPHILQLAFSLYDPSRRPVFEVSTLVKLPENVGDFSRATEVHGITTADTDRSGMAPEAALRLLAFAAKRADYVIAHNAEFDCRLLDFTARRYNLPQPLAESTIRCTAELSTPILDLPPTPAMRRAGLNKPKKPKLSECYSTFFNEDLEGAHDALIDTRACARVFFHLADTGAFHA